MNRVNDSSGSKNSSGISLLTERLRASQHELCSTESATPCKIILPAFASEFIKHGRSGNMTSRV
jgi:hypothetical protein